MGNVCQYCCPKEEEYTDAFADERARLLHNPVAAERMYSASGNSYAQTNPTVYSRSGDVNAMLTDIIDSVAGRVIDVGESETNGLEEQDFNERERYYGDVMSRLKFQLPNDMPRAAGNPITILSSNGVRPADRQQIVTVARTCQRLLSEMELRDRDDVLAKVTT